MSGIEFIKQSLKVRKDPMITIPLSSPCSWFAIKSFSIILSVLQLLSNLDSEGWKVAGTKALAWMTEKGMEKAFGVEL